MASISDFYSGTLKQFTVTCKIDGSVVDISGDTVTMRMKNNTSDTDANAIVTAAADVSTQGASGIAAFAVTPQQTAGVTQNTSYYIDILWSRSGSSEYVIYDDTIKIKTRVSDDTYP